ncbi:MAG TPA: phytanoyl-CoA dioxygenase family protein [Vitreimonas sp.]|uniref:phytanoyl-CoA dioxygenase family protein n=1 Tax=Vitreimonas sp. TaxID=3069702 RepID=UPI002D6D64FA|nr:phytanoyl-CoA dioxygenase family protein [Vitreimonas sp.]HYD89460.1 phytanoyl-CoA dioxygenase family protein [Vitreimonas sp.]
MSFGLEDREELETAGRVWRRKLLSVAEARALARHCDVGNRPGIRLLLTPDLVPYVGVTSTVSREVAAFDAAARPVRLVAFNKSAESNWGVPWHQDRVIAVAQKFDVKGYSNWVAKSDYWHCEPPTELLENMLFVRIHLDHCEQKHGAMEIALGSHKHGFVEARRAGSVAGGSATEICEAEPGDVLILKALTLHRSRAATELSGRRALRVDFARRGDLDRGLEWSFVG